MRTRSGIRGRTSTVFIKRRTISSCGFVDPFFALSFPGRTLQRGEELFMKNRMLMSAAALAILVAIYGGAAPPSSVPVTAPSAGAKQGKTFIDYFLPTPIHEKL